MKLHDAKKMIPPEIDSSQRNVTSKIHSELDLELVYICSSAEFRFGETSQAMMMLRP